MTFDEFEQKLVSPEKRDLGSKFVISDFDLPDGLLGDIGEVEAVDQLLAQSERRFWYGW